MSGGFFAFFMKFFIGKIKKYLEDIDVVLVMSVEPGFGGQSFQEQAIEKIQKLSSLKNQYHFLIEVDGGVNEQTARLCEEAGADVVVAGSAVFNAPNRRVAIEQIKG